MSTGGVDPAAFVNLKDVQNGLRRMQLAGHNLRPVFRRARKALRADMKAHANDQQSSDGAWPSLKISTIKRRSQKKRRRGRPRSIQISARRKLLGKLPRAIAISYTGDRIIARSRAPWSGVVQRGGTVGHRAHLPKREWLWASTGLLATVARLAVDYLAGAWEKKE